MYINSVEFTDFAPFAKDSRIEFAPVPDKPDDLAEVHLLTGENGTGKSRLLCLLAAALGEAKPLQARFRPRDQAEATTNIRSQDGSTEELPIGLHFSKDSIAYHGGHSHILQSVMAQMGTFARSGLAYLEDEAGTAVERPTSDVLIGSRLQFRPSAEWSRQILMATHKAVIQARLGENPQVEHMVRVVESSVSGLLGEEFRFAPRTHPIDELLFKWRGGTWSLTLLPDGLRAILGYFLDAALVMEALSQSYSQRLSGLRVALRCAKDGDDMTRRWLEQDSAKMPLLKKILDESEPIQIPTWLSNEQPIDAFLLPSILLLDEIETHLHPSWQWKVLPAFQRMFPKAQIFVATHSPFVIASLNKGWIHRLRRGADGVIDDPRPAEEGDSYETALEDIQGVKQRFDPESEALLEGFYK